MNAQGSWTFVLNSCTPNPPLFLGIGAANSESAVLILDTRPRRQSWQQPATDPMLTPQVHSTPLPGMTLLGPSETLRTLQCIRKRQHEERFSSIDPRPPGILIVSHTSYPSWRSVSKVCLAGLPLPDFGRHHRVAIEPPAPPRNPTLQVSPVDISAAAIRGF